MRLLTNLDRATLAAYCGAYALWAEATAQIQKYGAMIKSPQGFPIQSPYLSIANRQAEIMMRIASELGFTPASRSRIANITTSVSTASARKKGANRHARAVRQRRRGDQHGVAHRRPREPRLPEERRTPRARGELPRMHDLATQVDEGPLRTDRERPFASPRREAHGIRPESKGGS